MLHPVVQAWFSRRFGTPTPAQQGAWPAIAQGADVLVTAPTGSGKTLAAFLHALDRVLRAAWSPEGPPAGTEVLYVSPLKALSNDVHRNLEEPLAEIAALAAEHGLPAPEIRTAVRTGDTPPGARQKAAKRPPHVLVTTPESLYLLLTSESGRRGLATVRTVVIDEIHAVLGDKRGAHLALSLERLDDLVRRHGSGVAPQRVGLSATVRPVEVAARFLVGAGRSMPRIVDASGPRELDLCVEIPDDELGAVATHEQWEAIYDRVAAHVRDHRSTLVFVNTRRLVERVAHHLGRRLGESVVAAHHGSLARARRLDAERRLKAGELSVVVATASLELGIDVGAVEAVCVLGSPRSISTALQRIGRSGHAFGGTPKGRLFPLTRDQLVECAAVVRASRRGVLEASAMRDAPLDVLAQQIAAACAAEPRGADELFAAVRRAGPYGGLTRGDFDAVVATLVEGVAARRGRSGALLVRDDADGMLRGRRGTRLLALTSGGAIPDNADYDVVQADDGSKVGTLNEDFAIESSAGDVFLLGNTSWRIRRVSGGTVFVDDAKGAAPSVPFWLGEAPARSPELSSEVAALRADVARGLATDGRVATARALVDGCALTAPAAELVCDYVAAAVGALGCVPTEHEVVVERFFDEAGGTQLVIHAPFGGRINRAWGLALRKRFCRSFDFELQAAATDDGVLLSLGAQHSFPLDTVLGMLHAGAVRELLEQASLQAPIFATRWRWNGVRWLALPRRQGDRKVPPPIMRMRADDLLAAVFPAAQGCQDNHGGVMREAIELPEHPLVRETIRDCLTEAMDTDGLCDVLRRIADGSIAYRTCESAEPSVFSHEILNANPYAFLDDAPLEERRARAVSVRRGLPQAVVDRIGGLDAAAIAAVVADAAPRARDAEDVAVVLSDLGVLPEAEGLRWGFGDHFAALSEAGRAAAAVAPNGLVAWVVAEHEARAAALWPGAWPAGAAPLSRAGAGATPTTRDEALLFVVRARMGFVGPATAGALAESLAVDEASVLVALAALEGDGLVLRGRFSPELPAGALEWCDRRLLARIHRRTTDRLRRDVEPVTPADLVRFLFAWHGVGSRARRTGTRALLDAVGKLQGFEAAAGAWESDLLPARVADFTPTMLDASCLSGEVAWGRVAPRAASGGAATPSPTRVTPITLARRRDLGWLLAPIEVGAATDDGALPDDGCAARVLEVLRRSGASFHDELEAAVGRTRSEIDDALWELVGRGLVTGDGFAGLRALLASRRDELPVVRRWRRPPELVAAGRWSLLRGPARGAERDAPAPDRDELLARQYLARWGVVLRELVLREASAPPWRELVAVYRRLELCGEIRAGRIVHGLVGEQFALPEALDALRAVRRSPPTGERIRVSACDPLNLSGILASGPRVPSTPGRWVSYRDGVVIDDEGGEALVASA